MSKFKITIRTHHNKSIWTYKQAVGIDEATALLIEVKELLADGRCGKTLYLPFEDKAIPVDMISCDPYLRPSKEA